MKLIKNTLKKWSPAVLVVLVYLLVSIATRQENTTAMGLAVIPRAEGQVGSSGPVCGNGVIEAGEICDTGHGAPDTCPRSPLPLVCNRNCICVNDICGDGVPCTSSNCGIFQPCDDGNTISGDGCSSTCQFETCGNGVIDGQEQCDTSAPASPPCPSGTECNPPGPLSQCMCTFPFCGNGIKDTGEQCDDGNHINGDGCDANCTLPFCGNGIKDKGEQCDDGNHINGDGCDANCTFPSCGNGILDSGERCDPKESLTLQRLQCFSNGSICSSVTTGTKSCTCAICGNGIVAGTDECDEGAKCLDGKPCEICDRDNDPEGPSCITDPCTHQAPETGDPEAICQERESKKCTADCQLKCEDSQTVVCHVPPGNPDNARAMCVGENAVEAHLNHGDHLGACGVESSTTEGTGSKETPEATGGEASGADNSGTTSSGGETGGDQATGGQTETAGGNSQMPVETPNAGVGGCSLFGR